METVNNIVSSATKVIWGENSTAKNETAGQEPVSGLTGDGTVDKPYNKGNEEKSQVTDKMAGMQLDGTSDTEPSGKQKYVRPDGRTYEPSKDRTLDYDGDDKPGTTPVSGSLNAKIQSPQEEEDTTSAPTPLDDVSKSDSAEIQSKSTTGEHVDTGGEHKADFSKITGPKTSDPKQANKDLEVDTPRADSKVVPEEPIGQVADKGSKRDAPSASAQPSADTAETQSGTGKKSLKAKVKDVFHKKSSSDGPA